MIIDLILLNLFKYNSFESILFNNSILLFLSTINGLLIDTVPGVISLKYSELLSVELYIILLLTINLFNEILLILLIFELLSIINAFEASACPIVLTFNLFKSLAVTDINVLFNDKP